MKYIELCELYEKLEGASKRLDKAYYISELIKKTSTEEIEITILLLQGKLFPDYEDKKIGVASKLVLKAIVVATGEDIKIVEDLWKNKGDLGDVAKELAQKKKQQTLFSSELSAKKVFSNLRKLAELEGQGSTDQRVQLIAELLTSAKPLEAKYIIRTVLEMMRVGVGEGVIRDAIVWSCFPKIIGIFTRCSKCNRYVPNSDRCAECGSELGAKFEDSIKSVKGKALEIKSADELKKLDGYESIKAESEAIAREAYNYLIDKVQNAYDLTNNFAEIIGCIRKKGLEGLTKLTIIPGTPIKVMLYPKAKDIKDAFDTVGKPAAFEYKYDGFRILVNKYDTKIKLFTRRLEDVTAQFPDVVSYIKTNVSGKSFIIDSEAVGFDAATKKYLPFQSISQRIKRKYDLDKMAKEFPVELNVFDIVYYNGESLLNTPFKERRALIEKIVKESPKKIVLAKQIITDDINKAEKFYKEALAAGEEGVMAKSLEGIYKPGSRVGYGVKVKPNLEPLDLVIIGAQWGEGKRSAWLSSFELACGDDGKFLGIGKVGTGIKELESEEGITFKELTKQLKPLIISEKGKSIKVKPSIIIEVGYSELQKSPTYESGFALRFPKLVRVRSMEKSLRDITELDYIKKLYKQQK